MKHWPAVVAAGTAIVLLGASCVVDASLVPNCEEHIDDDQIALACNIYWEARTESYEGMMAVVAVTMNRVGSPHYPNTVAEVVWQNKQFSWTHDGLPDRPRNKVSWSQAMAIAKRFTMPAERKKQLCGKPTANQIMAEILGRPDPGSGCTAYGNLVSIHVYLAQQEDPTHGALYYHADYVEPYWRDRRYLTRVIGRHLFYAQAL